VRLVRVLPFVLALSLLAPSHPAQADDPREVAFGHYARGLELVQREDYQGALREFIVAYDVSPHFAVLYNIGQCQVRLGHLPEAVEMLSRYLGEGRYLVPADRRRQVGDQVAELASRLNSPQATTARPATTDRSLEKAAQDAAEAAERAGEAAARAAKVAHAAAAAARVAAAAATAAARAAEPARPQASSSVPVAAQRSKR
jgi:tetratricopeptide (TPR) repeat protein